MLTSQANDICTKEKKQTILESHIRGALTELGMDVYLHDCPPAGVGGAEVRSHNWMHTLTR